MQIADTKRANPFELALSKRLVELAGVEPASKISLTNGATCLVFLYSRQCAAERHATQRHTRIEFNASALEPKLPRDPDWV